jgi:hypothetical protein
MRNAINYFAMLFLVIASFENSQAAVYYSRTSGGNWSDNTTWSTVTYGNATNTLTFPKTGDSAMIGDGYTVILNSTQTTGSVFVGQGSSGILEYASGANASLTIQNNLTINTNAKVWYNSNATRTHTLIIGGNLTNNGVMDLYFDANDLCNLTFNRSLNGTVSGSGSFDLNTVTLNKSTSTAFQIEIQSTTFEAGIRTLTLTYGTYFHNNSSSYTVNPSAGVDFTIGANVILKVSQGLMYLSSNRNNLILNGIITLTGGTIRIGSSAGLGGIKYDKTGTINPKIEVTAGTLDVYGGITFNSGASTDPVYFSITGGTIQLNTGSSGTPDAVMGLNDVAGSTFIMSGGTVILSKKNTTGFSVSDFSICGTLGSVSVGGGTIQFGDENTPNGTVFNFNPVSNVSLPNFKLTGSSLASVTLCPNNNSTATIKVLSLYIDINKTFDVRSCSGTTGDTRNLVLTGNYDGVNSLVLDGTFITRSSTLIMQGSESQQIGGSSNLDLYRLQVDNTYGVTVNDLLTVSNQLEFIDGVLYSTASGTIKLANGASTTGASALSYVDGNLLIELASTSSTNLLFPIGKDGIYRPIDLQVQNASSASTVYEAELINTSPRDLSYTLPSGIEKVSGVRYFALSRTGAAGLTNAAITINYDSDDLVTDENYLRILGYDGSSSWVDLGGVGSANPTGSITSANFNNFRTIYALGNAAGGSNPLPVTYLNFDVIKKLNCNSLKWATASETNNDIFEVQRSPDLTNFSTIGTVKGAGFSNEIVNYQFDDYMPFFGKIYYRLKQIDFNGEFSYSDVRVVNSNSKNSISFYPNPVHDKFLNIKLQDYNGTIIHVNIYNNAGLLVESKSVMVDKSLLKIEQANSISNGCYIVKIYDDNKDLISVENIIFE